MIFAPVMSNDIKMNRNKINKSQISAITKVVE